MIMVQDIQIHPERNEYTGCIYAYDLTTEQMEELGITDENDSIEIIGEFKLDFWNSNHYNVLMETCIAYNGTKFIDLDFPQISVNHIEDNLERKLLNRQVTFYKKV